MAELVMSVTPGTDEQIAAKQLSQRLAKFGWVVTRPFEGMQNSLLVHIHFQGQPTGVSFPIFVTNVTNRLHGSYRRSDRLVFECEVQTLLQLEALNQSVILVAWDSQLNEGHWGLLAGVIDRLEHGLLDWRTQATVYIDLPWANKTDDNGLIHLRHAVIQFLYPLTAGRSQQPAIHLELLPLRQPEAATSPEPAKVQERLHWIQERAGLLFQPLPDEITGVDWQTIERLATIIERGKTVTKHATMIGRFDKNTLKIVLPAQRQGKPFQLRKCFEVEVIDLFGRTIPLGRNVQIITGSVDMPFSQVEQLFNSLRGNDKVVLSLINVEVIEIFPDWFIREAQRLGRLLAEKFDVESVYLFGSLAWDNFVAPETDIDLAVKGLPAERYFEAVGYLEDETKFDFDLVDLDHIPEHLRHRILAEGKLLNESRAYTKAIA